MYSIDSEYKILNLGIVCCCSLETTVGFKKLNNLNVGWNQVINFDLSLCASYDVDGSIPFQIIWDYIWNVCVEDLCSNFQ